MWEQVDSILASFLEQGDVVMVPDDSNTIVHVRSVDGWVDGVVILCGTDDEWGEEFEYALPDNYYIPLMLPVE